MNEWMNECECFFPLFSPSVTLSCYNSSNCSIILTANGFGCLSRDVRVFVLLFKYISAGKIKSIEEETYPIYILSVEAFELIERAEIQLKLINWLSQECTYFRMDVMYTEMNFSSINHLMGEENVCTPLICFDFFSHSLVNFMNIRKHSEKMPI